ncbi:uncharacterized protein LOC111492947 [Cucurbita maxima]|uniref:Uncharacterized protein LOC111492947 n=1 Tax=Cucurbita maxima TaxID=3661 RepID=A0A6J1K9R9_CUCMA|nr:uncharacterized protein LOC111492947 [Cucurbita maxima]
MKKKKILSLVIWLLFLMSPLSLSLSHALLQDGTVEPVIPGVNVELSKSLLREETLVGFDGIGLRKMGNGRKRIMRNDERDDQQVQDSSRISGKNKSFQTSQPNHQESVSSTVSKNWRHSKRVLKKQEDTQRLVKAAREIANLMHRDYKDWAHRKPPINNYEPMH